MKLSLFTFHVTLFMLYVFDTIYSHLIFFTIMRDTLNCSSLIFLFDVVQVPECGNNWFDKLLHKQAIWIYMALEKYIYVCIYECIYKDHQVYVNYACNYINPVKLYLTNKRQWRFSIKGSVLKQLIKNFKRIQQMNISSWFLQQ